MKLNILNKLNPIIETTSLLGGYYNPEELTIEKFWEQMKAYGITQDKRLNDKHLMINRYIDAFKERVVVDEGDDFYFTGEEEAIGNVLVFLLMKNQDWLTTIDHVAEETIHNGLIALCFEADRLPTSAADVITIFSEAEAEYGKSAPDFNWKFLQVYEQPKKHMKAFIDIVNKNIPAYEYAYEAMKAEIEPLLADFEANCETYIHQELEQLATFTEGAGMTVYPSFTGALTFMLIDEETIIAGLCYHEIYGYLDRRNQPVEKMVPVLKVLGDNSKFEILRFLRQAPNYNVEIAKHLGLTPATVSHHMNALFAMSLVTMKQGNKKVYYSINEEQIKKIISNLEIAFL